VLPPATDGCCGTSKKKKKTHPQHLILPHRITVDDSIGSAAAAAAVATV